MPPLSPDKTRKLVAFVAVVTGTLGAILAANVAVRGRTSAFEEGAGTARRAGLERLARNPTACAMTMRPSPDNERPMRHVNAGILGPVDVLVLGQSDADHMSGTFFKDGVRFYNGFISNSYYVYQYEVFVDLVAAHGVPKFVLFDVRSGRVLTPSLEPGWDSPPPGDPVWWGFPPFHLGKPAPRPWYEDIPSLLSLAQTAETLTWVRHQLPHTGSTSVIAPGNDGPEEDTGAEFRCVSLAKTSNMYRWMADGSRIYEGELDGVLPTPKPPHLFEAIGDRHINETRLVGIDWVVGKLVESGTNLILYSPPLHPVSFEDKKQADLIHETDARIKQIADKHKVDYCDLADKADAIGCGPGDFSDELHISRGCNRRIVREIVNGCAPIAGGKLRALVVPELLK